MKTSRIIAEIVGSAIILPMTAACSGSGSTHSLTCDQYASQSFNKQGATEQDLLKSHNLDPYSVGNTVGLLKALSEYCGLGASAVAGGTASANHSSSIDNAVDWSNTHW